MFLYGLGEKVELSQSGEKGFVRGRAEYTDSQNSYLVLYRSTAGTQMFEWWGENCLEAIL